MLRSSGGFLIVSIDADLAAAAEASKVRGDVVHVLQKEQVKHLKKEKLW
jgi:hypothetical protein